jgi:hypothetical protein
MQGTRRRIAESGFSLGPAEILRLMSSIRQTRFQFLLQCWPRTSNSEVVFHMNAQGTQLQFHRRNNVDGTVESICLKCFLTVRPEKGLTLEAAERVHSDNCTRIVAMDVSERSELVSRKSA